LELPGESEQGQDQLGIHAQESASKVRLQYESFKTVKDLVPLLGETRGLWAALLGHELSHDLLRHSYRDYILLLNEQQTQAALQQAQAQSSSATQDILLGLAEISNHLLDLKVLREHENEADRTGMVIMAEAGYHPDFALELNRLLIQNTGDVSKFQGLFQDHPRFATRELRELKEYDQAEAEFRRLWPDASSSLGGVPPPIAIVKSVRSSQDKPSKALLLTAEIEAHNVEPSALIVFATFDDHGHRVQSLSKGNSLSGSLVGFGTLEETGPRVFTWKARAPTSATSRDHRKLKAVLAIGFDNAGRSETTILDYSSPTDVEFPK
jgi:hypothetical protein